MKPINEVGAAATVVAAAPSAHAFGPTPIDITAIARERNNEIPWPVLFLIFLDLIKTPTFPQFPGLISRNPLPAEPAEPGLRRKRPPLVQLCLSLQRTLTFFSPKLTSA